MSSYQAPKISGNCSLNVAGFSTEREMHWAELPVTPASGHGVLLKFVDNNYNCLFNDHLFISIIIYWNLLLLVNWLSWPIGVDSWRKQTVGTDGMSLGALRSVYRALPIRRVPLGITGDQLRVPPTSQQYLTQRGLKGPEIGPPLCRRTSWKEKNSSPNISISETLLLKSKHLQA